MDIAVGHAVAFRILQPSLQSLFVEVMANGYLISSATAFVCRAPVGTDHLITNRHVVTGRNQETGEPLHSTCAIPDTLRIYHNGPEFGQVVPIEVPLLETDTPLWTEHPSLGDKADLVALRIRSDERIRLYPHRVRHDTHLRIEPADRVSVVGFPFGERTAPSFAVWATGFVASEPDIDHGGRPVFLIDCRTRRGQSGSPVILGRSSHGYLTYDDGSTMGQLIPQLLGVYSGRINAESDLGIVWKASAIADLLLSATAADAPCPSYEARPNSKPPGPPPVCAYHPPGELGASPSVPLQLEP